MDLLTLSKPYKSSNGHTVTQAGRLLFHVTSRSNPLRIIKDKQGNEKEVGVPPYVVDFETMNGQPVKAIEYIRCNCPSWRLRGDHPCRHCRAACEALAMNIMAVQKQEKQEERRSYKLDREKRMAA